MRPGKRETEAENETKISKSNGRKGRGRKKRRVGGKDGKMRAEDERRRGVGSRGVQAAAVMALHT